MKLTILTALAVASLFAFGNACAQETLRATVPFDFYVGQAAMPSGNYEVLPWANNVLLVRHQTKGIAAFYPTYYNGTQPNDKPVLVFHKYEASPAKYFLSEVRGVPLTGRLALRPSALEQELRATVRTSETVTVPEANSPQNP